MLKDEFGNKIKVKDGKIKLNGKTYYLMERLIGHVKNYYLFTRDEIDRADTRFRKHFSYK